MPFLKYSQNSFSDPKLHDKYNFPKKLPNPTVQFFVFYIYCRGIVMPFNNYDHKQKRREI